VDIDRNIKRFMSDPGPDRRYASFDYCFNYFQGFREQDRVKELAAPQNIQLSCLHLGFYLASWGMFRSSVIRSRSVYQFRPVVELIANTPRDIWEIDADSYCPDACRVLVETASQIRRALQFPRDKRPPSDTLVTKIMLGVFGNVPAFDIWVRAGLISTEGMVGQFGTGALQRIGKFYKENEGAIERNRIPTLEFGTGETTERKYTRAKVIDMVFYVEGGGRG
jgi:hypothetical protein